LWNAKIMKNGKRRSPENKPNKGKSRGTAWAEQTRAQCNTITGREREKLLDYALEISYGAET
jgi:hypothetical protein